MAVASERCNIATGFHSWPVPNLPKHLQGVCSSLGREVRLQECVKRGGSMTMTMPVPIPASTAGIPNMPTGGVYALRRADLDSCDMLRAHWVGPLSRPPRSQDIMRHCSPGASEVCNMPRLKCLLIAGLLCLLEQSSCLHPSTVHKISSASAAHRSQDWVCGRCRCVIHDKVTGRPRLFPDLCPVFV